MARTPETVPFSTASQVTPVGRNVYRAFLEPTYCVGAVPNGGYVASTIVRAVSDYLGPRGHPDTVAAHFEFIDRTDVGPVIIEVTDIKSGRSISVVHVTLYQGSLSPEAPFFASSSRKPVLAYVTNMAIRLEQGLSLSTGWEMQPPAAPVDFDKLRAGKDPRWTQRSRLATGSSSGAMRDFSRASLQFQYYFPSEPGRRGEEDVWLRFASGENFTDTAIPLVADALPYIIEAWRPHEDEKQTPFRTAEMWWYPTLSFSLDVKKALPGEGSEWLFMRCFTRSIKNGRLDLQSIILDQHGELVALAHHVNLVVPASRNLQKRKTIGNKL
ncbi:hypothetical protein SODALDRAFT_326769 [Sodiomyces alkalinus F11]|uniref:Thioesterase family protein n=1 Tax=Sodiomyces alkalinus (strain CBS 110278 / VKM F-3762 / F11) TaxID=1314773 RepID=A0A3N2Q749_SODAK|nr:hypothetical protein SODALDRAFT_326769 [Sodiomyces alkalinus F11]ROT42611.1 hypothetical protein SODALDRAFT_326769 [Sodiomyces alkalinus F11]